MSGIEKIYGTNDQFEEMLNWLAQNRPQYCRFLYQPFGYGSATNRPISNFPIYADKWLYKNCPLKWVKKAIEFRYNGDPNKKKFNKKRYRS